MKKTLALLVIALALAASSIFAVTASGTSAPPKPNQHYVLCGPGCGDPGYSPPPNSTCTKFTNGAYQYHPYPYLYYCIAGLVGPGVWQWVGIVY